jgi:hypothetical protein
MPDLDPVSEIVWTDEPWREPLESLEDDGAGALVPDLDLSVVTEILVSWRARPVRGGAELPVVEARLSDETVVITSAPTVDEPALPATYEIRLPESGLAALKTAMTEAGLTAAPGEMRVRFFRDGGLEETVYLGLREIRVGWGSSE